MFLILVIRAYQRWLQPESGCIYEPVCSDYYIDAIRKHGSYHGFIAGSERLARCTRHTLEAHLANHAGTDGGRRIPDPIGA